MEIVLERLKSIEHTHNVKIFFACESGSRAWGFPSKDSDYDVRFLYHHPRDWYLTFDVEDRRDVIELPIIDDYDINGWDIRKALKLLRKSNPPLLEWLNSPIIYKQDAEAVSLLHKLMQEYYSPRSCRYHYMHMARGNFKDYLRDDTVRVKKYFYALRPLLAIRWIETRNDVVPMEFGALLDHSIGSGELRDEILALLERKKLGEELGSEPRIDVISGFIEEEIRRLEKEFEVSAGQADNTDSLNEYFRWLLEAQANI